MIILNNSCAYIQQIITHIHHQYQCIIIDSMLVRDESVCKCQMNIIKMNILAYLQYIYKQNISTIITVNIDLIDIIPSLYHIEIMKQMLNIKRILYFYIDSDVIHIQMRVCISEKQTYKTVVFVNIIHITLMYIINAHDYKECNVYSHANTYLAVQ